MPYALCPLAGAAAVGVVAWIGSQRAMYPARQVEEHRLEDHPFVEVVEAVRFLSLDGTELAGWFIPAHRATGPAVILAHGYGRSRAELLPHARYLHRAGYHVLMFDFRGRGESGGRAVTVGAREPLDVRGAVAYLRGRPEVDPGRIAVQGVSLGASAGILAAPHEPGIAALVCESAFTDMAGTVRRSFEHFIRLPPFLFARATVFVVERRLRASIHHVRPIDAIRRIGARPVLIIDGARDIRIPHESGKRLHVAAPGPKELWIVEGAGHAGSLRTQPEEYERRVLDFYARHLGAAPQPSNSEGL